MAMKVLMALSGGVDSAVSVRLLQDMGYQVYGLVIKFSPAHGPAVEAAGVAARELGIPLSVAECEDLFDKEVVGPFCAAYASGRTPNPCVVCNPKVKFNVLLREAHLQGIDTIATGHYARLQKKDGNVYVRRAASAQRDQSYMLYRLPQEVLSHLLLPAGELDKHTIRIFAESFNLSCADAPDSQEICFIPDGDYAGFIAQHGYKGPGGRFVGPSGEDLGPHKGVEHYTVGQRKGLGVALGKPVFVQSIQRDGNVLLAHEEGTYATSLEIGDIHTADGLPLWNGDYRVKIRSMAQPVLCRLSAGEGTARLEFQHPQRSPAPGQHAVLYQDDLVIGGGVIDSVNY